MSSCSRIRSGSRLAYQTRPPEIRLIRKNCSHLLFAAAYDKMAAASKAAGGVAALHRIASLHLITSTCVRIYTHPAAPADCRVIFVLKTGFGVGKLFLASPAGLKSDRGLDGHFPAGFHLPMYQFILVYFSLVVNHLS